MKVVAAVVAAAVVAAAAAVVAAAAAVVAAVAVAVAMFGALPSRRLSVSSALGELLRGEGLHSLVCVYL